MGRLIIVSSVSGAGKTTLVDSAVSNYDLYKLKTCTTRTRRAEEIGNEYYFFSKDEFDENVKNNEFFEHAEVYGNNYGLLKREIEKSYERNCIVVLDVQGAQTARMLYDNVVTIFIEPPSVDELKYRIIKRNTGSADVECRLSEVDKELEEMNKFTYIVRNGSLDVMTEHFSQIIEDVIN